jgi:dCMP deaminase
MNTQLEVDLGLHPIRRRPTWQGYAILIAWAARSRSEDPHVKVGACVLRKDGSVAGTGYNGVPPGIRVDLTDNARRRAMMTHAEVNALRYTTPKDVTGGLMATTRFPCMDCVKQAASYGLKSIAYTEPATPTSVNMEEVRELGRNLGVSIDCVEPDPVVEA